MEPTIYKQPSIYKLGGDVGQKMQTLETQLTLIKSFNEITSDCVFSSKINRNSLRVFDDNNNKTIYVIGFCCSNSSLDFNDDLITLPNEYKLIETELGHYNTPCPQQRVKYNLGDTAVFDYTLPCYLGSAVNTGRIFIAAYFFNGTQNYGYGIKIIGYAYGKYL